jgi:hypothetical protein
MIDNCIQIDAVLILSFRNGSNARCSAPRFKPRQDEAARTPCRALPGIAGRSLQLPERVPGALASLADPFRGRRRLGATGREPQDLTNVQRVLSKTMPFAL